jgi:hypothetical protein
MKGLQGGDFPDDEVDGSRGRGRSRLSDDETSLGDREE